MKVRTHYLISKIAIKNNKKMNASQKFLFCLGSMFPDFTPNQIIHPHFYDNSKEYIFGKMKKLQDKKISAKTAFQYGKIAHYLSDFCCKVHKDGVNAKDLANHTFYEIEINKFAISNFEKLQSASENFMKECFSIEVIIAKYLNLSKESFKNDLLYSIKACSLLIV